MRRIDTNARYRKEGINRNLEVSLKIPYRFIYIWVTV